MSLTGIFVLIYLLAVNAGGFVMFGIDKGRAKRHAFRISERALLTVGIFGGSLGALLGMKLFRHKTKHKKFTVGLPIILIIQLIIICYLINLKYHFW